MAHGELIRFVAAASTEEIEDSYNTKQSVSNSLSGEEAKAFYENIVNVDLSNQSSNIDGQTARNVCNESLVPCTPTRQFQSFKIEHTNCNSDNLDCSILHSVKVENQSPYIDLESNSSNDKSCFSHGTSVIRDETFVKKHNQLLGFAQNGDLEDLKKLLRNDLNVDIDYQDQYGWTALMCAAIAQHLNVVKLLLSKGANKFMLNYTDKNVFELCEESGAIDAKIVINTYHQQIKQEAEYSKPDPFFCDTCNTKLCESTLKQHSTSTAHLFNLKLKPKSDQYMIPESNRGFQLMKKSGWDGKKGLGPEGQGYKYPVKTFLKRDRTGLGTEGKNKTKVTHFGPKDANAVKHIHQRSERIMSVRAKSKRERKCKEQKARHWERNLRTYMNIDL